MSFNLGQLYTYTYIHTWYNYYRYEYRNELDIRLEYTLMSASLYKTALSYSLPTPSSDYDFADYQPPRKGDSSIFPGVEVFSDTFRCPPLAMLSSLQWCGEELISRRHAVKVHTVLMSVIIIKFN